MFVSIFKNKGCASAKIKVKLKVPVENEAEFVYNGNEVNLYGGIIYGN